MLTSLVRFLRDCYAACLPIRPISPATAVIAMILICACAFILVAGTMDLFYLIHDIVRTMLAWFTIIMVWH